jgi:hypothetical protein
MNADDGAPPQTDNSLSLSSHSATTNFCVDDEVVFFLPKSEITSIELQHGRGAGTK